MRPPLKAADTLVVMQHIPDHFTCEYDLQSQSSVQTSRAGLQSSHTDHPVCSLQGRNHGATPATPTVHHESHQAKLLLVSMSQGCTTSRDGCDKAQVQGVDQCCISDSDYHSPFSTHLIVSIRPYQARVVLACSRLEPRTPQSARLHIMAPYGSLTELEPLNYSSKIRHHRYRMGGTDLAF
jgi:hypothetical protein